MSSRNYPRTQAIMVLARKAVNTPHGTKDCLKHLEACHDAVEALERDLMAAKQTLQQVRAKVAK